jgi:hypothetical protein
MLKVYFIKIGILLIFYWNQFFLTEFTVLKFFIPKPICTISLHYVYLGPIFLEMG